jgi:glucan endo-1,3-alpha-glucosidase
MPCAGDSSETCGQSWYISLYMYNGTSAGCAASTTTATAAIATANTTGAALNPVVPGTTTTGTTTTGAATTGTTTTGAASPTSTSTHTDSQDSSEWYSLGCAVDTSARVLSGYSQEYWYNMTTDDCLTKCEGMGYPFAGTEFGQECYCALTLPTTISYSTTGCNMNCGGDSTETCGGNWFIELYELISAANASCTTTATTSIGNNNLAIGTATTTTTTAATTITAAAITTATTATTTANAAGTTVTAAATSAPSSSTTHNVWAHHMVGNTYPYAVSDWASDIAEAYAAGIDGFALNMGSDSWQPDRINDAYTAATSFGNGFKLFLSLDMTVLSCGSSSDAANLVSLVQSHASSSAQAMHNGQVLVSTFAGSDCTFGTGSNNAWQTLFVNALTNDGVDIFFVPSVFSDVSTFSSDTWMDGELNWNSGWPMGSTDLTTASDTTYMNALGSKEYMPAISPFFFTHFGVNSWNKNWLYRSDDWLYATRWEQVIAMRDSVKMTEILTWNDFGESSYIGPIHGALPAGSDAWVDGYDHQGLSALTKYYATAFKTGSYPAITTDTIVMWSRPHSYDAVATSDSVGRPTGWDWTQDYLYAVVLCTEAATVTLTAGSNTQTFSVSAGLSKLKVASSAGGISGSIARNGATTASYTSTGFSWTTTPATYNYNYFVGSSSS